MPKLPRHFLIHPWLRFNLGFWPLFVLPFALVRLAALLAEPPLQLYQLILFINPYVVPIAMTALWLRTAYRHQSSWRSFMPYLFLGAAALGCNVLLLHPALLGDYYNSYVELTNPVAWAANWLPSSLVFLLAYALLLRKYSTNHFPQFWRVTGTAAGSGLIILVILFAYTINVPGAARQALKSYLATRPDVATYTVEDTRWTHSCCAESTLAPPTRANHVRYLVRVTLTGGRQELETIDFADSRNEAAQLDDLSSGIGGHQQWRFIRLYRPGETIPADVWSI